MFIFTTDSKEPDRYGNFGFKSGSLFDAVTGIRYELYLDLDEFNFGHKGYGVINLNISGVNAPQGEHGTGIDYNGKEALEFWHKLYLCSEIEPSDAGLMLGLWDSGMGLLKKINTVRANEVQS